MSKDNRKTIRLIILITILVVFSALIFYIGPNILKQRQNEKVESALLNILNAKTPESKKTAALEYNIAYTSPFISYKRGSASDVPEGLCAFMQAIAEWWYEESWSHPVTTIRGEAYSTYEIYQAVQDIYSETCEGAPLDL